MAEHFASAHLPLCSALGLKNRLRRAPVQHLVPFAMPEVAHKNARILYDERFLT